jgi:hypothetical protein
MSEKSSIVDRIPVAGIVTVAAETLAKKAGAEDRDARLIGTLAGAVGGIIKAVASY